MKMSSISDKKIERTFLIRKSSFQRIKCSATYPLEFAGSLISKGLVIQLLEKILARAKEIFIRKPLVLMVIPVFNVLFITLTVSLSVLNKLSGGVSLIKLNKHISDIDGLRKSYSVQHELKKRHASNIKNTDALLAEISKDTEITDVKKNEALSATDVISKISASSNEKDIFYDCKENEISLHPRNVKPKCQKSILMSIAVMACTIYVFLQLTLIIYLLNGTELKPGLVFQIICILCVGYIALKISFVKKEVSSSRMSRKTRFLTKANGSKGHNATIVNTKPIVQVLPRIRQTTGTISCEIPQRDGKNEKAKLL